MVIIDQFSSPDPKVRQAAGKYGVVALPGEGIGPEVVSAALRVLDKISEIFDMSLTVETGVIGESAFEKTGNYFPPETAVLCEGSDGILFGSVSKGGILELRKHFDFYANLRPISIHRNLLNKSSLRPELVKELDILFVRELASGIYFGESSRAEDCHGMYGYHTMRYYDWEIRRVAKVALRLARQRRRHLTVVHKENALPHLHWSRLVNEEAGQFDDVNVKTILVDNLAMQLVRQPSQFDVILAGNLFGDILSDIGGALTGSIGLLASASLNDSGLGLYEAVHGTAPDIAGKGIANPLGMINAVELMLQQWGEYPAAQKLHKAIDDVLSKGYRTFDLNPQGQEILVSTNEITDLIVKEIDKVQK